MHRVRVGLTGLACVFLLVLLATAMLRLARRDSAPVGHAAATTAHTNASEASPSEPLAQLGVVPGNPAPATANTSSPKP